MASVSHFPDLEPSCEPYKGRIIAHIETSDSTLKIYFEEGCLVLNAFAECCSTSRFEYPEDEQGIGDISNMVGKKIWYIHIYENKTISEDIMRNFDPEACVKMYTVMIMFDDNNVDDSASTYDLILFNDSNGYYSGWVEIEFDPDVII